MLLSYHNFSQEFIIHIDASKMQIGGLISKNGKPISFYSRNLNPVQLKKYYGMWTVKYSGDPKMIPCYSIRTPYNIIYGPKHLAYDNFTSERVLCWKNLLE